MLEHLSTETSVFGGQYPDWETAMRAAGKLLEKQGYIQPAYTEDMVAMVRENGPYIVIMPGVALAHTRPQGNVRQNSVALVTIQNGIAFGNKANDPVRALFAIAAVTDDEHLTLFREVAKYIEHEENVEKLFAASKFEELF